MRLGKFSFCEIGDLRGLGMYFVRCGQEVPPRSCMKLRNRNSQSVRTQASKTECARSAPDSPREKRGMPRSCLIQRLAFDLCDIARQLRPLDVDPAIC